MSKSQNREITLDTETTGLNPMEGHRVVEIGCVELINRVRTGRTFHVYLNPGMEMPLEAYNIHGLSTQFLSDKPSFRDVAKGFLGFVEDSVLVIHNAPFDVRFLNKELADIGMPKLAQDRVLDTLQMARKKYPGAQATLDALCRRYNIDLSKRTKHGALLDADLLVDVYVELTGGVQDTMLLEKTKTILKENASVQSTYPRRPATAATEEEMQEHQKFLKSIKKPVWEC